MVYETIPEEERTEYIQVLNRERLIRKREGSVPEPMVVPCQREENPEDKEGEE